MIVIDCSALVLVLTAHGSDGELIRNRVAEGGDVYAPTLLDYEIQSALLGMQRGGKLTEKEVERAVAAYRLLPIAKRETLPFWERVRKLHANLSAYDSQYVALAEALGVPLITSDARIKRSGAAKCEIEVFASIHP
ncbi:putative nucleic acid-binding protein [Streptomyces sp. 1114.5]|uniref:type II toxin-antitoxin system VapC family toxin n=1 Tax=unclassified Streptomyces TaxID=2593676 RepID=UPI000BC806DA|nr:MULTISPECIES: type II toxin-antitoxin system VapC family toxin [unclassified Streptomyces]RKT16695.1 putative nucleic acid-binding protein [Streptomyces sp. 1114.5]SOB82866.1 Predicted nucleic acid-binding protein, contains PIN domain [Streptomyces sp. 1331.2]